MKLVDVTLGKLLSTKRTVPWNIAIFQILTVTRLIRILTEVPRYNSRPEPYASWVHHGRTTSGGERVARGATGGSETGAFECNDTTFGTMQNNGLYAISGHSMSLVPSCDTGLS